MNAESRKSVLRIPRSCVALQTCVVIDIAAIRIWYGVSPVLNERGRRRFAAAEALTAGCGDPNRAHHRWIATARIRNIAPDANR
jgi:hypothetical protein